MKRRKGDGGHGFSISILSEKVTSTAKLTKKMITVYNFVLVGSRMGQIQTYLGKNKIFQP
jgi:hypothetical protein